MTRELSAEELLEVLVKQDELAAQSTDRADATVRDAKWKLDALAAALRAPASPVPFEDESDCRRVTELIAALGTSEIASQGNPDLGEIGQYRLLEKLGQGGMGTVYKAMHTRLEKIVALKVLRTDRISDSSSVTRFEREMKAVGRLDHPNIVRALDANEDQGTHYLVMEYVDGRNLSDVVRSRGPIFVPDACELIRQAALALQEAHQQGLVHRDIKPSNLMLTGSGQVKLLDLGLARLHEFERDLTMTGQVMGTLDYIAPEQVGDSHDVDTRADLYSLGATLYKLLTGYAPFEGQQHLSPLAKLSAMATEPIVPVKDRRSDVPAELSDLIDQMLSADPNIRPQSASVVAAALEEFTAGNNLSDLASDTGSPSVKPQAGSTKNLHSEVHDTGPAVEPSLAKVSASMLPSVTEPPRSEVAGSRAVATPSPSPADSRNRLSRAWSRRPPFAAAALGVAAFVLLLLGAVYVLQINQTRIVVEIADPAVEALLKDTGLEVRDTDTGRMWRITTVDAETLNTIEPGTGNFRAEVPEESQLSLHITDDGGAEITGHEFTLKRGDTVRIRVALSDDQTTSSGEPVTKSDTPPDLAPSSDPMPDQPERPDPPPRPVPVPPAPIAGDVIPGLIPRPAPIDGVRRWQIETRAPRHEVTAVAFHPFSELVAYGTKAGHVRIYDAETMQLKHWLPGPVSEVRSLEWSRNGEWLAAASNPLDEGTVQLWRTDGSYGPTMRFGIFIEDFSWKSDSSLLAVVGRDRLLFVNPQGKIISVFRVDAPRQVAWSPDDEWLAIGSPGSVQLLKDDGSRGPSFEVPDHDYRSLSWNSDATQIACVLHNNETHFLHLDGTAGLSHIENLSIAWHPKRNVFAVGLYSNLKIIDEKGREEWTLDLQREHVYSVAWSGDGRRIAWGSSSGQIGIWNSETGQLQTPPVEVGHVPGDAFEALTWHPDGQRFAVCGGDLGRLRIWNADGSVQLVLREFGQFSNATWSSDGKLAYNGDLGLEIWDANDTTFSVLTPRHSRCIAWSPDGSELAISDDEDLTVSIWSRDTGRKRVLEGRHAGYMRDVCFSPIGDIASADDGTVRIWNADGSPQRSLPCDRQPNQVAWSPDGSQIAAAADELHLWDTQDFSQSVFQNCRNPRSLDWRHDGQMLASGQHDGEVRLWDPDGTLIKEFRGHKNAQVPSVAWQPRSSKLLSLGKNNTIILWNTETAIPEWIAVDLNDAGTATFGGDGQLLHGDPATVDAAFVYLVETDDGQRHQLRHSEFVQKFDFRKDSSALQTQTPPNQSKTREAVDDPDRRAAEWALSCEYASVTIDISPEPIEHLTDLPAERFKVLAIRVDDPNMTDADVRQLSRLTHLVSLELRQSVKVTWSAIESLKSLPLRSLDLPASALRNGGFRRLATVMPDLTGIEIIAASDADLAQFQKPQSLRELKLDDGHLANLSSEGVKQFEGWGLRDLSISAYSITDETIETLSTLELHSLGLHGCDGFTERGVSHLLNARRLTSLGINSSDVTDDWLETLKRFEKLESLNLTLTNMTPAAVAELQRSLPSCRVESDFTPEELQAHALEERDSNQEAAASPEEADKESLQEVD